MVINNFAPSITYINYNTSKNICQDIESHADRQRAMKAVKDKFSTFLQNRGEHTKAKRVQDCGTFLQYKNYYDIGYKTLHSINLCRERLCLNCQTAKSRERLPEFIYATQGKKLRHITFTVKNVKAQHLRQTILTMRKALKAFMRSQKVRDYIPSIEITYNEKTDTYHPHIHMICRLSCLTYSNSVLKSLWAKSYNAASGQNNKYLLCKNNPVTDNISAAFELCKYVAKPLSINEKTIPTLYTSLKGLHLHQANGIFKKRITEYRNYNEAEKKHLENLLQSYDYILEQYLFDGKNYIKVE